MQNISMTPDFGLLQHPAGTDERFVFDPLLIGSIGMLATGAWSTTSYLVQNGVRYSVSVDFIGTALKQMKRAIGRENAAYLAASLRAACMTVLMEPVELLVMAALGKPQINTDELYVPFRAIQVMRPSGTNRGVERRSQTLRSTT